jgi:hypothetical protein
MSLWPPKYGSKEPQLATEDPTDILPHPRAKERNPSNRRNHSILDPTLLPIANELASQQAAPTQAVLQAANRLLSYCAAHLDKTITYHACDMILHVFVDASYLSRSHARSVAGAILFLGDLLQPTKINGPIHCFSTTIIAALFAGGQQAAAIRTILEDLGYPQPSFSAATQQQLV